MQYRKLSNNSNRVSLLGYGCMRFHTKNGKVDEALAFKQMKLAFDNGVNYFDTAYIYHRGHSEILLGKFIKKYNLRDKIYIADKLPTFLINKSSQINSFFNVQLKRLDTNYIDYYLMHMLDSYETWNNLKKLGILEFINDKKKTGEIKNIGFSFHGKALEFIKILEDYEWDFCQIQYNYLDINYQAGINGLKRAHELGIGVVIMEPLRGGSLANNCPTKVTKLFDAYKENYSPAYWSLRWIMNQKEVSVVLSGMNEEEHILENIKVTNDTKVNSMNSDELKLIDDVRDIYQKLMKVSCTGCNYCMPCPLKIDIPETFSLYNSKYFFGNSFKTKVKYIARSTGLMGRDVNGVNKCINCNKCKRHCPQNIDIPTKLKEADKELNSKFLNIIFKFIAKLYNKYRNKKINTK